MREDEEYGWETKRCTKVYPEVYKLIDAIEWTDINYDEFIEMNAAFFEMWKGALSHSELCKMNILTRYKYFEQMQEYIEKRNKEAKKGEVMVDDL